MALDLSQFAMGAVWASLTQDEQDDVLGIVYARLAPFGIENAAQAVSQTEQGAVAIYARLLAERQASGDDIDIPDMVREMLTIPDQSEVDREDRLTRSDFQPQPFTFSQATPLNPVPGAGSGGGGGGGTNLPQEVENALIIGVSQLSPNGIVTFTRRDGREIELNLATLEAQSTLFGVPEGDDGDVLRFSGGQAFFDKPGGSFYFQRDLVAVWGGVSDSTLQDPLAVEQEAIEGQRPERTWQETARIVGAFRGVHEDFALFRSFSLFPNRAVASTDQDGEFIRDNDGNLVYALEKPVIILLIPGTLSAVKQRPLDGASDGSDDEDVTANFVNTGTVMLNTDGTAGAGKTAYTRYAWNYPPDRQPRFNNFSPTSGSNDVRLLLSYDIPAAEAPQDSKRAITSVQIAALLDLADNPPTSGEGVPEGGTIGQVLAKASLLDYDTHWIDPPAGTSSGGGNGGGNGGGEAVSREVTNISPAPAFGGTQGRFVTLNLPTGTTLGDWEAIGFSVEARGNITPFSIYAETLIQANEEDLTLPFFGNEGSDPPIYFGLRIDASNLTAASTSIRMFIVTTSGSFSTYTASFHSLFLVPKTAGSSGGGGGSGLSQSQVDARAENRIAAVIEPWALRNGQSVPQNRIDSAIRNRLLPASAQEGQVAVRRGSAWVAEALPEQSSGGGGGGSGGVVYVTPDPGIFTGTTQEREFSFNLPGWDTNATRNTARLDAWSKIDIIIAFTEQQNDVDLDRNENYYFGSIDVDLLLRVPADDAVRIPLGGSGIGTDHTFDIEVLNATRATSYSRYAPTDLQGELVPGQPIAFRPIRTADSPFLAIGLSAATGAQSVAHARATLIRFTPA